MMTEANDRRRTITMGRPRTQAGRVGQPRAMAMAIPGGRRAAGGDGLQGGWVVVAMMAMDGCQVRSGWRWWWWNDGDPTMGDDGDDSGWTNAILVVGGGGPDGSR